MSERLDRELFAALVQRKQEQRYRSRMVLSSPQTTHVQVEGADYLAFCSNDYLGLANHPRVVESFQCASAEMGVGSGASHLVSGHSHYHHLLEQALAEFTGRERALLLSTGYMANLGVISALANRGDTVLEDRLNHASLIDAGLLSGSKLKRFQHNDLQQLQQLLSDSTSRKLVVVDGVFSMDGDLAPLPEISQLCEKYEAHLMVDDAHGFGVLGEQGGGCAEHFALLPQQLPILVGTLGKAFGTFGAFVAGSQILIESLIQFARPYIYTTALPPAVAAATLTSLSLLKTEAWRREHLNQRIAQFRAGAQSMGLTLMPSQTPIQPLVLNDDLLVMDVAKQLREQGVLVGAIRPPTVPEGTARLRISFSTEHTEEDVARLLILLDQIIPPGVRIR